MTNDLKRVQKKPKSQVNCNVVHLGNDSSPRAEVQLEGDIAMMYSLKCP